MESRMKTKTYDVQIEAIITKTIRVGAVDESEAREMAHELFDSDQMYVKHEQNTLDVSEVSDEDRYEKPAWVKGDVE